MKIKIEPIRLRNILSAGLIVGKGKPLLESVVAEFNDKGVSFKDISLEEIAVYALYAKKFFSEFSAEEGEDIPLSSFLLTKLKQRFKEDEQVTLRVEGDRVILEGTAEKELYRERMPDLKKREFPIKMTLTKYGFLPTQLTPVEENLPVLIKIPADKLSLGTADKYTFDVDGKFIRMTIEDEISDYSKALKPTEIVKLDKLSVLFDAEFFSCVVANLMGEVWWGMNENMAIFSQTTRDSAITFILVSREI